MNHGLDSGNANQIHLRFRFCTSLNLERPQPNWGLKSSIKAQLINRLNDALMEFFLTFLLGRLPAAILWTSSDIYMIDGYRNQAKIKQIRFKRKFNSPILVSRQGLKVSSRLNDSFRDFYYRLDNQALLEVRFNCPLHHNPIMISPPLGI